MNLKSLVIGTPLEHPARRFLHMMIGGPRPTPIAESELREARDNAYVRALLKSMLKRDSVCIDVGAHQGFFLGQFLEFAPMGQHLAFEPIPKLASELKHKFPSVKVYENALSDYEGQTTFQYVPEFAGWSGLRRQSYPRATHPQSIQVTLRRLDHVVEDHATIAFIKIDVEGAELEVLRGAAGVLRRQRPVVYFECAKIHHINYETTPKMVHECLTGCGMGLFLVDRTGPLTIEAFTEIYEVSHQSGYDRKAHSNYLAFPI